MNRILVAVDFSDSTSEVVQWGVDLARAFHAAVCLVNVATPMDDWVGPAGDGGVLAMTARPAVTEADLNSRRAALLGIKDKLARENVEVETHVLQGPTAVEIIRAIDALQPYLVILGSHRHSALRHMLLGGVGLKLVRKAPCPVLVVHSGDAPPT